MYGAIGHGMQISSKFRQNFSWGGLNLVKYLALEPDYISATCVAALNNQRTLQRHKRAQSSDGDATSQINSYKSIHGLSDYDASLSHLHHLLFLDPKGL